MFEQTLIAVLMAIIEYLMSRHDETDAAKAEVYRELYAHAKRAYEWETLVVARSDHGATLRVREHGGRVELQGDDSGAASGPRPA